MHLQLLSLPPVLLMCQTVLLELMLCSPTIVSQTSQFSSCQDEQVAKRLLEPVTKDALVEAPLSITPDPLSCQGPTWPSCSELTRIFQANLVLIWQ